MLDKKIFSNTKRAFILKSDEDLKRSIFIFKLISIPSLVPPGIFFTKLALKLRLPIEWLIKKTIFKQFCGGTSLNDCLTGIKNMYSKHVYSVLDYSVEGKVSEEEFDKATDTKINIIKFAAQQKEIPFAVAKPTGLGRFEIWHKVSENKTLTPTEEKEWQHIKDRIKRICKAASEHNVKVMFDAEESWMQDAADQLIENMMKIYNKDRIIVFNTMQCYRWDRLEYVKQSHLKSKEGGYKLGFKIVRGAYMEKENKRAEKLSYATPICKNKAATDNTFNQVMYYCLNHLDDINLFIGTHNEESTYGAITFLEEKQIDFNDERVWFGQLYGMSENLTFNLGIENFNAVKLVPFGPVRDVIPYLFRRAQENTSVQGQTSRELNLLLEESQRRKKESV